MRQPTTETRPTPLDLRKQYQELYRPSTREVMLVEVPELLYITVDGTIAAGVRPSDSMPFREAMAAVYGVAYTLKFMSKFREQDPIDFKVMPVEGLWATESGGRFDWKWTEPSRYTLLMTQPDHITSDLFEEAVAVTGAKRANATLERLRLERWLEGPAIQVMHVGPYAEEPATIHRMDLFAKVSGYELHGRHHEIYIGDPNRSRPERLKTILRHAVRL